MISFSEIPPAKAPLRIALLGHSVATNLNNYIYEPKNYLDDARQKLNAASIYEAVPTFSVPRLVPHSFLHCEMLNRHSC